MDRANFEEIREYAVRHRGFKTLRQDGIDKIRKGLTSPEEVLRVTIE
jgi:type IV pilus assembly protein PilB